MAVSRIGLLGCLFVGACDFGIDTTGLAGEGGFLPDTGSDVVAPDDAGDESTPPPDDTGPIDTGPPHLFGDTNVESNQDNVMTNDPDGFRYRAIAGGTAQTVWVYVDSQTSGASFDVGIYDDDTTTNPESPKGLLAFATFTTPSSGWAQQTLNQSITITQDSFYWIVMHPTNGTLYYRNAGSSGGGLENVSTNNATLPSSWSSVNNANDGPASMYVAP
jgi:hypothetical protein